MAKKQNTVKCKLCSRSFKREVDLKTHIRWGTKCIPKHEQIARKQQMIAICKPQQPINPASYLPPLPSRIISQTYPSKSTDLCKQSNSLRRERSFFYYTAIPGNRSPHSDDDFPIVSDHEIEKFPTPPQSLFEENENNPPREDGRRQDYIDYVAEVMKEFMPPTHDERLAYERVAFM